MINLDLTLWIQIVEALLLTFILYFVIIKPIMGVIEERQANFKSLEKEIENLFASVDETLKQYKEKLEEVRREGVKAREELKEEARRYEKELLSKVMKEVEEKKKRWYDSFVKEIEEIRKKLEAQKEEFAMLIVERILGRRV